MKNYRKLHVQKIDDQWFFSDETGFYLHGCFDSREEAEGALESYKWQLEDESEEAYNMLVPLEPHPEV